MGRIGVKALQIGGGGYRTRDWVKALQIGGGGGGDIELGIGGRSITDWGGI